jgi:hypothetical protein
MSFGLVNFATHLQQATGPSFTTLQRKNKESSKQKGSYIIFKAKPECFQYLFFLHDLNGGKLNTPPPRPPPICGCKSYLYSNYTISQLQENKKQEPHRK